MKASFMPPSSIRERQVMMNASEKSGLIQRIQEQLQEMKPAQRRIAVYILRHQERMADMSIGQLARESRVSEATISRFAKQMGCDNYRAFQREMVRNDLLRQGKTRGYEEIEDEDDTHLLCRKVFEANIRCLSETQLLPNADALEKIADSIAQKRKIWIVAQGRSAVTGKSITERLERIGITVGCFSDPHEQAVMTAHLEKGDLFMGISNFGRSRNVVHCMRRAREAGAFVIGVSSGRGTPMEETADIMLYASGSEDAGFGAEPSGSTVAQMVILDCLYVMTANRMGEEAERFLDRSARAVAGERI